MQIKAHDIKVGRIKKRKFVVLPNYDYQKRMDPHSSRSILISVNFSAVYGISVELRQEPA